jgi:hypothetical protein
MNGKWAKSYLNVIPIDAGGSTSTVHPTALYLIFSPRAYLIAIEDAYLA